MSHSSGKAEPLDSKRKMCYFTLLSFFVLFNFNPLRRSIMAAILQFPFAEGQVRAMREQPGGRTDLDGDVSEDTQRHATGMAEWRSKQQALTKRIFDQAPRLVKVLEPVLWRWKGTRLRLSFAAKGKTIRALAAEKKKATVLFSAIDTVTTCEYEWTIVSVDDIEFDPDHCLFTVSFTVAEAPESEGEDVFGIEDEEYRECLRPGENDANFHWRYVFKKQG